MRVVEESARHRDHIRLAFGHDLFRLLGVDDHADGADRNASQKTYGSTVRESHRRLPMRRVWDEMEGIEKPIINQGFITVPEKPGLGVTLNDEVVKQHLLEPGYFEPTPDWDKERSHDRTWS